MCLYGYQLYSSCAHRLIKLASLCQPALFDVALTAGTDATPCPEHIYTLYTSDGSTTEGSYWQLYQGNCPHCFNIKPAVLVIDRDVPLDQFIPMAEYNPALLRSIKSEPLPDGEISTSTDNKHPYIRTPSLRISWYKMLGVEDQLTDGQLSQVPFFNFRGRLSLYKPGDDKQWKVGCVISLPMGRPLKGHYLFKNGGLTKFDRRYILQAANLGKTLRQIHGERFAARGMVWDHLHLHVITYPEVVEGPDLDGSQGAEAFRKCCQLCGITGEGPRILAYPLGGEAMHSQPASNGGNRGLQYQLSGTRTEWSANLGVGDYLKQRFSQLHPYQAVKGYQPIPPNMPPPQTWVPHVPAPQVPAEKFVNSPRNFGALESWNMVTPTSFEQGQQRLMQQSGHIPAQGRPPPTTLPAAMSANKAISDTQLEPGQLCTTVVADTTPAPSKLQSMELCADGWNIDL